VLIPLFSMPSRRSWGIGEIPDLGPFARWMCRAGLDFVQLLPIDEMDRAHNSPYAAVSAMAIDPLFVALDDVVDFGNAGGEQALPSEARDALAVTRSAGTLQYDAVRVAKTAALELAFDAFDDPPPGSTARTQAFHAFVSAHAWWLDDYTLFRALHDESGGGYWREWEEGVRHRRSEALRDARARLARRIRYHAYVQWIADEQWRQTRRHSGVAMFGDFPFMVSGHSADVWSRQSEFRLDASVGVPPDATSASGQDWGLPAYRWEVSAAGGHGWLRQRADRCAALFDGFRIDHLVGFYRTFVWERDGTGAFVPADERDQIAQGETLLQLFASTGARLIAEDLGTVPDFVRESMSRLGVPGLKVLRWERQWDEPEQPFRDPAAYPQVSVATTGTHDTETLAEWWSGAEADERRKCAATATMRRAGLQPDGPFSPAVRDALVEGMFAAGSDLVLLPIQDVFGWPDRVNNPEAGSQANWTWRLPWRVEDLMSEPEAVERAGFLRSLGRQVARSHRL
jgi:4-alpha-glucanotransferase